MSGNILYKYLDVKGGLAMLSNSKLQFTNATRFNDPFDCHPALFDFSNVPVNVINWPPANFIQSKGMLDKENERNNAWICSFSKVNNSLLMWSYYTNHKGICIGIDIERANQYLSRIPCGMTFGPWQFNVQYKDIINKPDFFRYRTDSFRYQLATKAKAWEHEQEVRLVLIDPSPEIMGLPYKPNKTDGPIDWKEVRAYPHIGGECFDSVYLGIKIDKDAKEKVIELAKKLNPNIKIYQMSPDPNAFRIIDNRMY